MKTSSEEKGIKREIKFRAWEKPDKSVVFDGAMHYDIVGNDYFGDWLVSNDYEVMQYTGLKDKNGKEIYEGDIVMIYDAREPEPFPIISEKVIFENGKFMTEGEFDLFDTDNYSYEIIGNIYENPDLLI